MDTNAETTRVFESLAHELADPDSQLDERVGSTYAFEIETDAGLLHLLFRLDNGNPERPSIEAIYLGGHLATDYHPASRKRRFSASFWLAPLLVSDE